MLAGKPSRAAGLLCVPCMLCCAGCGEVVEAFVFLVYLAVLIAIFVPVILAAGIVHMVFAVMLGKTPPRPRAFGWIAVAWLVISIAGFIAVFWLQRQFTRIQGLEVFYSVPAVTLFGATLAAYTRSRLGELASDTRQAAATGQPAEPVGTPIGRALRGSNVVFAALPQLAEIALLVWSRYQAFK